MKSINSKRNFRQLITVAFLLTAIFYLPVSGQIITNIYNQVRARMLYDEAVRLFNQGTEESYKQALPKFQEAARLYLTANVKKEAGISLLSAGNISSMLGEKMVALGFYNEALDIFKEIADVKRKATTLNNIGLVYFDFGDKQKALDYYKQSLFLNRQIGDKKGEVAALSNIGSIYSDNGDYQEALNYYTSALLLITGDFQDKKESSLLNNIGTIHYFGGRNQEALENLNRALLLDREAGNKREEAQTLTNIGAVYNHRGNKQTALGYYNLALSIREELGDKKGEAQTFSNIGVLYSETGDKRKALNYHNLALSIFREIKHKSGEAAALSNFGIVYAELWEKKKALEYYDRALSLFREANDKNGELITLSNIGGAYYLFGEYEKALEYYKLALPLAKQIKNKNLEAIALNSIGVTYTKLGRYQEGLEQCNLALALKKTIKDRNGESETLANIGLSLDLSGKKQEAVKYYNQALLLSKLVRNKNSEAMILTNLMVSWDSLNDSRLAAFYGQMSIDKFQNLREFARSPVIDIASQKLFLSRIQPSYIYLLELLIKRDEFGKAVQILNFYQDQQFFDLYQDANFTIRHVVQSPREQEFSTLYQANSDRIEKIDRQVEELKRQINNGQGNNQDKEKLEIFETELNLANNEFLTVLKRAETEFAKSTDDEDKIPPIKDVTEMQSVLSQLNSSTKQETAALYTLIGEKKFYVLLITAKGSVKVFESPIDKQDFNKKLIYLYALLQSPAYDPRVLGEELYKIIIPQKLEDELKKQKIQTLMWQLDGNLRYIPMAALWDGEKYLVEKYLNVVLTRADSQRLLKETKSDWTGIGFGTAESQQIDLFNDNNKINFRSLSGVREELTNIFITSNKSKGVLKGEVYADKDFTKERFYEAMKKRPQVVHISSHFRFYPGDSALSFLVLGDGKALTLNELKEQKGLFEGVDLLTLSACETGAILPNADGREIDGFAELAQRLGANAVMASLWQVREYSTSELMTEFYSTRQKGKLNKAESLRLAQLNLLKGNIQNKAETKDEEQLKGDDIPTGKTNTIRDIEIDKKYRVLYQKDSERRYAHPYYWSPFILFGNWK